MGGSKGSTSSRQPTAEETALLEQQTKSLQLADSIAQQQFGLSTDDRSYLEQIFRGKVDPNHPTVKRAISDALQEARDGKKITPLTYDEFVEIYSKEDANFDSYDNSQLQAGYGVYSSSVKLAGGLLSEAETDEIRNRVIDGFESNSLSVEQMLFDGIKSSKGELSLALTDFADKTSAINAKFGAEAGGISTKYSDNLNFIASEYTKRLETVADEYKNDATKATEQYGDYTKEAIQSFNETTGEYQTEYKKAVESTSQTQNQLQQMFQGVSQAVASRMGTADEDLLAQQRGQALAGISQSYKEVQDELLSTLGRRGLTGSGVEAKGATQLAQDEARMKAQQLSASYNQSIGLSDQRRMNNLGIAGNVAQSGIALSQQQLANTAAYTGQGIGVAGALIGNQQAYGNTSYQGSLGVVGNTSGLYGNAVQGAYNAYTGATQADYQSGIYLSDTMRNLASGLNTAQYQGSTANTQQYLANLQMGSGIASGIYTGASNMLAGAGSTANQTAQVAGSTATQIGATDASWQQAQMANSGGITGALLGVGGSAAAAYLGNTSVFSDSRLKTNIQLVGKENGFNIYTWDWIEGHDYGYNKGVIAQEVMETYPEAVIMTDEGYYAVDYNMIGVSI